MPKKGGTKTPKERAFLKYLGETGNAVESARRAGYAAPDVSACNNMQRESLRGDIVAAQLSRISNELLPLAVDVHKALLTDPRTPAAARVQAVKLAYDRAFGVDGGNGKAPHEMTGEELAAEIDKLKRAAADRARPVIEHEPKTQESAQPAPDIFG